MVVSLTLIVLIIASFVFVYIENERVISTFPDTSMHVNVGNISSISSGMEKYVEIGFKEGVNLTFEGRDIVPIVLSLPLENEYKFYWKWDSFYTEVASVNHVARRCVKIESMNGDTIYTWHSNEVSTIYFMIGFLSILLIIVSLLLIYNKK
jgi:hypothetical protein